MIRCLLGLLVLSALALKLGDREKRSYPSAMSVHPSGVKAFADLLTRAGYAVRIDRDPQPRLDSDAVADIFQVWDANTSGAESDDKTAEDEPKGDPLYGAHKAVVIAMYGDFETAGGRADAGSRSISSPLLPTQPATVTVGWERAIYGSRTGPPVDVDRTARDELVQWRLLPDHTAFALYRHFSLPVARLIASNSPFIVPR